uniref:uncharacterized protein LOC122590814 n=1 Tax=Erigeron canadensis TaxID=72917 RepID=UPI001CB947BB|nr:uncharacterized protein LOC122590814 [Erigeron canadensis]
MYSLFPLFKASPKLQHLEIWSCDSIGVIVKEDEDGNHTSSSSDHHQVPVVFASLKSVKLSYLRNLEGFFLGTNNFRWPVLDDVVILKCPKIRMFTKGHSDTPLLKYVTSHIGEHSVECGQIDNLFHHHPTTTTTTGAFLQQEEEVPYDPSLDGSTTSLLPISPRRMPWFYNHLIKVYVTSRRNQRFIIGNNELQHMLKIEKLKIAFCSRVKEIFETLEMDYGLNQSTHSVLEVRKMDFRHLKHIKCLWKSKQWALLKFPNLTRLSIDNCHYLKHVFTISMVGSLLQLQELHISGCLRMEVIVVEDEKEDENEKEQNDNIKEDEDDDERRGNKDDGKDKEDDDDKRENKSQGLLLRDGDYSFAIVRYP